MLKQSVAFEFEIPITYRQRSKLPSLKLSIRGRSEKRDEELGGRWIRGGGGALWLIFLVARQMRKGKTSFASFLINIQHPTSLSPQTLDEWFEKKTRATERESERGWRAKASWKELFNYFFASIYVCKMFCWRAGSARCFTILISFSPSPHRALRPSTKGNHSTFAAFCLN